MNSRMIWRRAAPMAMYRPISEVRWLTATSITFMIRTPATIRLIPAIPPSAAVIALKMPSNTDRTASCVMVMKSCLP